MRSSIQLATLNYALVVAEEGSFLRASRRTGIDHSAVSRRIRDLEYAVGTRISPPCPRRRPNPGRRALPGASALRAARARQHAHSGQVRHQR
ncbi:LysR family transcriptional regulator [Mesorhizobium sp. M0700]|uniref:LysR family transcriptional regulator n=1 Tax=unclassified Mesorhizobium TaxID=325217 RepID=UPI003339627E